MAINLLAIVSTAALELGLVAPPSVVGNPDAQTAQMLALTNRVGHDLADLPNGWEVLRGQQLITMVPGQDTYAFPTDFAYYVPNTIWDRSLQMPVAGPVSAAGWQMIKSGLYPAGVYSRFRIMGGSIVFDPVPGSADTIAIEYVSSSWCQSVAGVGQSSFLADTDIPLIHSGLFILGLKWRFKQAKGFDYTDERATYDMAVAQHQPRDFVPPTLNMRGQCGSSFLNRGYFPNGGFPV